MTQPSTETGSDLLISGEQGDLSFLAEYGNCRHKPVRNTGNTRSPWSFQVLPKVIKHHSLATIGHHRTDMGPSLNSEQATER